MKHILIIVIAFFCLTKSFGQTSADLKKVIKNEAIATETQNEINRLNLLLSNYFLKQANNSKGDIHKQIQDFFADFKINGRNINQYNYPTILDKSNLTISVTSYDNSYELLPKESDTTLLEGNRSNVLTAIVTIPIFDNYHRGYSLNSITFICTLNEKINWKEALNNKMVIEKLPSYRKDVNIKIKLLEIPE